MTTLPYLTDDELHGLTHLVRPSAQARWLAANRIPFRERTDRTLLVLRRDLELREEPRRPNLAAVRRAG